MRVRDELGSTYEYAYDAKITYKNPLKKSSSKYQIEIKFAVITAIHCNINNFNFFLSSFIPDPPAKYQFLYSAIITERKGAVFAFLRKNGYEC